VSRPRSHAEPPAAATPAGLVVPGRPRERVQARLPDGRILEVPPGTRLAEIVGNAAGPGAVAAILNGRLRELTASLDMDSDLVPVTSERADGVRVYRRSLVLLLVTATAELFPDTELFVEHSATTAAGYHCRVGGRPPFSQGELGRIEARMREIVESDAPYVKSTVPVERAVALFRSRGQHDTARLLAHRQKETVALYALRDHPIYSHGYMVPSAGYLRHFALDACPPGFMLRFPHQGRPGEIPPAAPYPKLFAAFEEAGRWLDRLGVRSAGALNDAIAADRLQRVSLVAEALHEARIAQIAAQIADAHDRIRVVLVAGPSSSGKTTFSKRLAIQLLALGLRPFPLSLDDYFLDREQTPPDADGQPDYESLAALDVPLLDRQLLSLMRGESVRLPHYDFVTGKRRPGPTVALEPDHVLILEGIHGLNPKLVESLPPERLYKIYVSALTQLNLDRHNRVSTADCRLIRRVVRDAASRGYSARKTVARWEAVARGEKRHIFPFQENSDAIFNSSLVHELAVLRPMAEPLLLQIRPETPEFLEANRILSFLTWFKPAPPDSVPDNSILREFIGGSILSGFHLWQHDSEAPRDPA